MINLVIFQSCAWLHLTMNTVPVLNFSPRLQSEHSEFIKYRGPAGHSFPLAFSLGSFNWLTGRILPLTEMTALGALQKYHSAWPFHILMKLFREKEVLLEKLLT